MRFFSTEPIEFRITLRKGRTNYDVIPSSQFLRKFFNPFVSRGSIPDPNPWIMVTHSFTPGQLGNPHKAAQVATVVHSAELQVALKTQSNVVNQLKMRAEKMLAELNRKRR